MRFMSVNKKKYNRILKFLSVMIVIILTYIQNLSPFEALLHLFVDFEFQTINNPIINEFYKGRRGVIIVITPDIRSILSKR